jgi:hypothetical protein
MEGDSGIVARTYGTCVLLDRKRSGKILSSLMHSERHLSIDESDRARSLDDQAPQPVPLVRDTSRFARSDMVPTTAVSFSRLRDGPQSDEVDLLTIRSFEPHIRIRMGGMVTARSVKYLGNLASKLSDQETRDGWWTELRDEIRSHAKILGCTHVVGYLEASTIHDDVAILSITGTAVTIRGLPDLNSPVTRRLLRHSRPSRRYKHDVDDPGNVASDAITEAWGSKSIFRNRSGSKVDVDGSSSRVPSGNSDSNLMDGRREMTGNLKLFRPRRTKPCTAVHVPYSHRHGTSTMLPTLSYGLISL